MHERGRPRRRQPQGALPHARARCGRRTAAADAAGLDPADRLTVDLADLGPQLFDWSSADVKKAVEAIRSCSLVVVASPTYKASYTGLLKSFLDWFSTTDLLGVTVVPVMTGAGAHHALAVEVHLRPVLVELGASLPTRGLYVTEAELAGADDVIVESAAGGGAATQSGRDHDAAMTAPDGSTAGAAPSPEWDETTRSTLLQFLRRPELYLSGAPDAPPMPIVLEMFAHHLPLSAAWLPFTEMLASDDATLSPAHRELLILRVAWRTRSGYEWDQHSRMGADAGLTPGQIEAIAEGPAAEVWTPLERALLTAVDETVDDHVVGDATWRALAAHFGPAELFELLFLVGGYLCLAGVLNSIGLRGTVPPSRAGPVRRGRRRGCRVEGDQLILRPRTIRAAADRQGGNGSCSNDTPRRRLARENPAVLR